MDLSILIPARNEMFLARTIQDILEKSEAETEVIVLLDGQLANPPIEDNERITVVYRNTSIGQRAGTNEICRLSKAKYVMKVDAHCAFDQGFDRKMLEAYKQVGDKVTMAPLMRNLHIFDWVCKKCGDRRYQGQTPISCPKCDNTTEFYRDIVWIGKSSPQSTSYCFDTEPHFQYFGDFKKRPEGQGDITESMSLQGSCFMMTRDKYWELNICDEKMGSWGSQGIEVACKTWLSGGRVLINHLTWYAHLFRTQGGDFGFPYPLSGNQVSKAKKIARETFFEGKFEKQIKPLSWLVEKFWPVPGWKDEDLLRLKGDVVTSTAIKEVEPAISTSENSKESLKGIIYYTDNCLNIKLANICRKQLLKSGLPIVSASLKPMTFGKNIYFPLERGYVTLVKQILGALEASESQIVFFTEHDVLYHPSHFDFVPPTKDKFYYNQNIWMLRTSDGFAVHYDCNKLSQLCCYRDLAIQYYRKLLTRVEKDGWNNTETFEPGTHNDQWVAWKSEQPNVDIRHGANLTKSKWCKEDFRNEKYFVGWQEAWEIPFWGKIKLP